MLRAYKSNVPHNMDDAEFWTRYCQHLFRWGFFRDLDSVLTV